jgi:hypothetical protein
LNHYQDVETRFFGGGQQVPVLQTGESRIDSGLHVMTAQVQAQRVGQVLIQQNLQAIDRSCASA